MPFASEPVYVGEGDVVRIRYPTPSTWNTSVTVDVQIGTGYDEEGGSGGGVTFSTKVPDALVDDFNFNAQKGYTGAYNGNGTKDPTNNGSVTYIATKQGFQKATQYYSQLIEISGIEVPMPAAIAATDNGPDNNPATTNSTAQFAIWRPNGTSYSLVSPGWRTSVSADINGGTSGGGVQPGDLIQLRVTTVNWYITHTKVTFAVGESTVNAGITDANYIAAGVTNADIRRKDWNITTREQDQFIDPQELTFTDIVDVVPGVANSLNTYSYHEVDIDEIDSDAVLSATATGDVQFYNDQGSTLSDEPTSGWTQQINNSIVLGDKLWVRIPIGFNWTTKTSGDLTVYANQNVTYNRGGTAYRNQGVATFGANTSLGDYELTQTMGTVDDDWQQWTQVDRYPNSISAVSIFTYGVKTQVDSVKQGLGFAFDTIYETTGGSGSGMRVKLGPGSGEGSFDELDDDKNNVIIMDPGYGYAVNDVVKIISPLTTGTNVGVDNFDAEITLLEYEKVYVTDSTSVNATCEPGFMYFADMAIGGLGTEYSSGAYDNLESPLVRIDHSNPSSDSFVSEAKTDVAALNGQAVRMSAIIDGTAGQIRVNNSGAWQNANVTVTNGDTLNLKLPSKEAFGDNILSKVTLVGPPAGDPVQGNPTQGPTSPFTPNKTTTMSLTTRLARKLPYPFHAQPVFLSNPGEEHTVEVSIEGLDVSSSVTITSGSGELSVDGFNWTAAAQGGISISPSDDTLYIKTTASNSSGGIESVTYKIHNGSEEAFDTWRIYTKLFDSSGNYSSVIVNPSSVVQGVTVPYFTVGRFFVTMIGGGGGRGGDDAPNSFGAGGGSGNFLRMKVEIDDTQWPTQDLAPKFADGLLEVYTGLAGEDGDNFGTSGGAGGFGYANGGDGGAPGSGDFSGGGGGGGGASAIIFPGDSTEGIGSKVIAIAGGGGGGAGAGNDTRVPDSNAFGNHGNNYGTQSSSAPVTAELAGENGQSPGSAEGGGAGGGGGGFGSGGVLLTNPDGFGNTDIDATGGTGGGMYIDADVTLLESSFGGIGAAPGQDGILVFEFPPQDRIPDDFDFEQLNGIPVNTEVYSGKILISGITGAVPIQLTAPGMSGVTARVCDTDTNDSDCEPWGSSVIFNNQYLQIKVTTGPQYNYNYYVKVQVGEVSVDWDIITGPPPDSSPNFYKFEDAVDQPRDFLVYSEIVTITGINVPVGVSSTLGEININGTGWVSGATGGLIQNNETLQLRLTSSSDFDDEVSTTVTVGVGVNADTEWKVTTLEQLDTTPDAYAWLDGVNLNLNETYTSNSNKIEGISDTIYFQVTTNTGDAPDDVLNAELPTILLFGVPQLDANGNPLSVIQVENLDRISLQYTTTDVIGEARKFNTLAGAVYNTSTGLVEGLGDYPLYETDWNVTTAGSFVSTPDDFTFATKLASGPNVVVIADEQPIIAGLGQPNVPFITTNGLQVQVVAGSGSSNGTGGNFVTSSGEYAVSNGDTILVQLESSAIDGFARTGQISIGNLSTTFTVQTPSDVQDPIRSQWYSSIQPIKYVLAGPDAGTQIRYETKFDGLPIGTIMPVFQDATQSDNWGDLDGSAVSRFPGFLICDGDDFDPDEYPLLFAVLQDTYGAVAVAGETFQNDLFDIAGNQITEAGVTPKYYCKKPDYRNRYLKGTGVIDGTQLSSPSLVPTFQPNKLAGAPGSDKPGGSGGRWFIDTIGDPGVGELEQVETPAEGLPADVSPFFGIANVQTTGYTSVSGIVDFKVEGAVGAKVGLDPTKIYDVPLHFHELITGMNDTVAGKGRVGWNQEGGWRGDVNIEAAGNLIGTLGATYTVPQDFAINQWGYLLPPASTGSSAIKISTDYLPDSTNCGDANWAQNDSYTSWSAPTGYQGVSSWDTTAGDPIYYSTDFISESGTKTDRWTEVNKFIDVDNTPEGGYNSVPVDGVNAYKYLGAIDIPDKVITIKPFNPVNKLKHTHWVSLAATFDDETTGAMYGFGNNESGGNASQTLQDNASTYVNPTVVREFTADSLGIQVLPGTFTLSQTKQLTPTPSLAPQDDVVLMSPYTWVKWLIKAY